MFGLNFCLLDLPMLLRSYFASRIYIPLLLFNKLLDIAGELFLFLIIRYDRIRYELFRHTLLDHIVQVNLMRQYSKSTFFFSKFFQLLVSHILLFQYGSFYEQHHQKFLTIHIINVNYSQKTALEHSFWHLQHISQPRQKRKTVTVSL